MKWIPITKAYPPFSHSVLIWLSDSQLINWRVAHLTNISTGPDGSNFIFQDKDGMVYDNPTHWAQITAPK